MVAAGLIGVVGGMVARLTGKSKELSHRMRDISTIAMLNGQSQGIAKDPGFWVTQLRKYNTSIATCLNVVATGPWTCPAVTPTTDKFITGLATSSRVVSNVDLYDFYGEQIAGRANGQPLYYDVNGMLRTTAECSGLTPSAPICRFRATGYLIRAATGDPGSIILVRKVEQTSHTVVKGTPPVAPTYEVVDVGTAWKNPGGKGVPVGGLLPFSGGAVPAGYLLADGRLVSTTTYPQLYAVLGTTWGPLSGANFRLPDFNQKFPRGAATTAVTAPAANTVQGVSALTLPVGSVIATSDVMIHQHPLTSSLVSGLAMGTATSAVPVSANFSGQWMSTSAAGGSAANGANWFLPDGSVSPTISGTATVTFATAVAVSIPPGFEPSTSNASTAYVVGPETRPANVKTMFIIRADY